MKPIHHPPLFRQRGVTLIELLVGLTIGLLTIAVAMGALMVSRGVSGTVSDASTIQQQAAYAFRVMGQQLRQAGSLRLNLAAQKSEGAPIDISDPVAFEPMPASSDGTNPVIWGLDNPGTGQYALTVRYRDYVEELFALPNPSGSAEQSLQRNCLGGQGTDELIESQFVLYVDPADPSRRELRCNGNGQLQPIVRNVANFQVRYLMQTAAGTGTPQIRYVNAATVGAPTEAAWSQVFGVEVCLVLYGDEPIDLPNPSNYVDCDGVTPVNMAALPAPRNRRMHMVFRNIYQLRSQGQTG